MVKWNGKRDVIGMMVIWFLTPVIIAIIAPIVVIIDFPVLLIIFLAAASGIGYLLFKKRKP